jgi:hypothetical protein
VAVVLMLFSKDTEENFRQSFLGIQAPILQAIIQISLIFFFHFQVKHQIQEREDKMGKFL